MESLSRKKLLLNWGWTGRIFQAIYIVTNPGPYEQIHEVQATKWIKKRQNSRIQAV